jgi:hypothetical protein
MQGQAGPAEDTARSGRDTEAIMHNLFYIIGVIVVALIVLSLIA